MPDYARSLATARRLIRGAGSIRTLVFASSATADPSKPWETGAAPRGADATTIEIFGAQLPVASAGPLGLRAAGDELLKRTRAVIVFEPPTGSEDLKGATFVRDGGADARVTFVDELRPADTALLYFVGVSR